MDSENNKTMKHNETITDELIAKYISGNTSEEEEDLIHDYLARNPEFANDLLDIATALRHQHKHDAAIKKEKLEESKEAKRIQITPRRTFYAVAASIVILIGIGLLVFNPFTPPSDDTVLVSGEGKIIQQPNSGQIFYSGPILYSGQTISEEMSINTGKLSSQTTENVAEPKLKTPLVAENSVSEPQPQQAPFSSSDNSDAATMASLTVYEGNEDALKREDLVFITENMPKSCNIEKDLVLNWECNATSVILEFSTDNGETWKAPSYDITGRKQFIIKRNQLKGLARNNPNHCFCWRITAEYDEGSIERFGKVMFSDE